MAETLALIIFDKQNWWETWHQESEFRFISDQNKNQNIAENNVLQTIDQKLRIWQEIENCYGNFNS